MGDGKNKKTGRHGGGKSQKIRQKATKGIKDWGFVKSPLWI